MIVQWNNRGSYIDCQYYDCYVGLIRGERPDGWIAIIRMPGRYKITLPEAQEERAKKAAILAIETVGKAYNEFAASVISDKFDHCKRCMGSGLLESSDSTDDGLYDCYACKGTGRKEV